MSWYKSARLRNVYLTGVLKQTDDGFCYVDINNNVIHGMFKLVDEDGIEKPPYFDKDGIGAHISFIASEESEGINLKEVGKNVKFKFKNIKSEKPDGWEEMERVWFITVEAPELKNIRKKYKLPATYKNKGHDFHITIAVKPK